jgi:hypothetical protein
MTVLDQLLAMGATVNAGYLDYYDGQHHHRLGEVLIARDGTFQFKPMIEENQRIAHMRLSHVLDAFDASVKRD